MKKKKLQLNKETIAKLNNDELVSVKGGKVIQTTVCLIEKPSGLPCLVVENLL